MNILILGGTTFVGPHMVEEAIRRGHTVTLFNRGQTNIDLFPDIEKLQGDRKKGDLEALNGRSFDVVIDVNAYFPRAVQEVADAVTFDHYLLVSTISVFSDFSIEGLTEDDDVADTDGLDTEEVEGGTYGPLKVQCEQIVRNLDRYTILRPGLIVGPRDPTDRFTYWLARAAEGSEMLTPPLDDRTQFIDVRDFASFALHCVDHQTTGTYHVVTPAKHATIGEVLESAKVATGSDVTFVPLEDASIEKYDVAPWRDFPAWVSPSGDLAGITAISSARAVEVGLAVRSVDETVRDTWAWYQETKHPLEAGLSKEREAEILSSIKS